MEEEQANDQEQEAKTSRREERRISRKSMIFQENATIQQEFRTNLTKYAGADPIRRPKLPKLVDNRCTSNVIETVNKLIE